ncbi:hypothetical protein ACSS6W_005917 [Trichoderma asperelloides]
MTFLHWICETYLQPRRKRSKKKTVNQYWRDYKMLYRRTNKGRVINANDCEEIVKTIFCWGSHITGPVMRFPAEDDRLDLPSIMLFQAYTACRPAELVDGTKTRGGKDPLLDDMPMSTACAPKPSRQLRPKSYLETHMPVESDHVDPYTEEGESDPDAADSVFEVHDGFKSDESDDTEFSTESPEEYGDRDLPAELAGDSSQSTSDEGDERGAVRKHKALCYEDIIL